MVGDEDTGSIQFCVSETRFILADGLRKREPRGLCELRPFLGMFVGGTGVPLTPKNRVAYSRMTLQRHLKPTICGRNCALRWAETAGQREMLRVKYPSPRHPAPYPGGVGVRADGAATARRRVAA